MWAVFCPLNDGAALWAYRGLGLRGLEPIELVSVDTLLSSLRWTHRLGRAAPSTVIHLADGREFEGAAFLGVLNRISNLPLDRLALVREEDRDYGAQEFSAFFLSWLHSLPGTVVNPPTPRGLAGAHRAQSEWRLLAAKAGLESGRLRSSTSARAAQDELSSWEGPRATLFVVCGRLVGPNAPGHIADGCRKLALLAGTALLMLEFARGPRGSWRFVSADPCPDLRRGGAELLDALAEGLGGPRQ